MLNTNSRYVASPKKVLRQLLLDGKYPEVTKGKIIAGDAVELDVLDSLSMKGNNEKRFQLHQPIFDKLLLLKENILNCMLLFFPRSWRRV